MLIFGIISILAIISILMMVVYIVDLVGEENIDEKVLVYIIFNLFISLVPIIYIVKTLLNKIG